MNARNLHNGLINEQTSIRSKTALNALNGDESYISMIKQTVPIDMVNLIIFWKDDLIKY